MSLRSLPSRYAGALAVSTLLALFPVVTAATRVSGPPTLAQTISVSPANGTVLTSPFIGSLQVTWCDPTNSMTAHSTSWQGQTLAHEAQSWANRPGCGSQLTSTFQNVAVDYTKPLILVTSATDRSGQVTTNTTTYTMSPNLVKFFVAAVPGQATTISRGVAGTATFTVTNTGGVGLVFSLAATCTGATSCGSNPTSLTLPAGQSQNVSASYVGPSTFSTNASVTLTATSTGGGQNIAHSDVATFRTPDAEPVVSPKAAAGASIVLNGGQSGSVAFTGKTNPTSASGSFSLTIVCPSGWYCSPDLTDVTLSGSDASLTAAVTPLAQVGAPNAASYPVRLIATLHDGATVIAADTGVVQAFLAYHTPRLSPKSTAASVAAGIPHTDSFTLTNGGNATATYSLSGSCGSLGANGCTTDAPSITLAPGASGNVSLSYTPPVSGPLSGTVRLIARYQAAAPAEADTASVLVTAGDLNPPTIGIAPSEGATLTTRAVNAVVNACDSDGVVAAPTLTANGMALNGSFVAASQSGCATAGNSTFAVSAQPGTNTLVASVSDGVHTTNLTRTFVYDETVEHTPSITVVTPTRVRMAQAASADTFTVRNPGTLAQTYALAASCTPAVAGCSPSQTSIALGAGQSGTVVVSFTAGGSTGNAVVSLSATISGVTGHSITSTGSASVVVDASPPTVGVSPNGVVTATSPPTVTIQWCDAEGAIASRSVTYDGVALADVFVAATAAGCASAGASTYSNLSMAPGPHSIVATATDAVGHVSTTAANITFALPALAEFRPAVTPKNQSLDVFVGTTVQQTFTVRNSGTIAAPYQLAAVCPTVSCQISKTSTSLAPGATDSAIVTFTPTSSMGGSSTIGLRAAYTDASNQSIADTGTVVAALAQMASHAVPSIAPALSSMTVEPGVITDYYFVLRNTGTITATYDFSSVTSGGFTWPQGLAVWNGDDPSLGPSTSRTLAPGQTAQLFLMPRSPTTAGVNGQITLTATFNAPDGSISSAAATLPVFTRAPDRGIAVTPFVGAPQTLTVDRTVAHHEATFTIINTGVMSGSYQYFPACHGFAEHCAYVTGPTNPFVLAAGAAASVTIGYDATGVDNGFNFIELFGTQVETQREATGTILLSASATPSLSATVTPSNDQVSPPARTAQSVTFAIANTGGTAAAFSYSVACGGAVTNCASSAGLSGSTATLAPGGQAQVVVTYQSGDAGSIGTISLTARSADGSVNVTGTRTVSVDVPTALAVRARGVNPDGNVSRGQCLTISAGTGAAYECGDLRLVHALPTTTTMNKSRTPTLIFSSDHARPGGVIAAEVSVPASMTATTVRATLTFPAKPAVTVQRDFAWSSTLSDGRPRRIALRFEAPDWETGAYAYVFQVQAISGSTVLAIARDSGFVALVSRVNSPFGRGWWLDGLEQISIATPDSSQRLWVGGDGSTRLYTKLTGSGDQKWVVTPSLDRADTLYRTPVGYKRRLRDSAYVTYDAAGQQDTTVNAMRYRTSFTYVGGRLGAGGKLTTITIPTPSGAPAVSYQLQYTTVGTLPVLSTVVAPTGPNGQRTVRMGRDNVEASRVGSITDADGRVVTFGYDADEHLGTRTDPANHVVRFTYDPASQFLATTTIDLQNESSLVASFCTSTAASLASCAPSVVDTASVRTKYTSPRRDGVDTTAFFLTRYGAPRKIVDALGQTTLISRGISGLPLLVSRVQKPGRAIDSTEYDLVRALPTRTLTRVDSLRDAETRTFWNPIWDEPDSTVAPEGEITSYTYDARGNRKTQSNGRGPTARTATFNFDASNRVTSMFERGAADSSRVFYDGALGNVSRTQSAMGIVSYMYRDAIGRDSVTRSPLDAAQRHFTTVETRYDVMDRDTLVATTGPRMVQTTATTGGYDDASVDSLVVRKHYDADGNVASMIRHVNPNPNGLNDLITSWVYDAAHRKRRELSPDFKSDSTIYGDGINVTRTIDRRGIGVSMEYDELNRLKTRTLDPATTTSFLGSITVPGGIETFRYDSLGNMSEAANSFAIVDRDYNVAGTIRREIQRVATEDLQFGQHDYVLEYGYDRENRRLTLRQPSQAMEHMGTDGTPGPLQYHFNEYGDLRQIGQAGNQSPFNFFYDSRGRLDSLAYPNGIVEQRRYDDDGRLTFLFHRAPAAGLGWRPDGLVDTDTIQWAKVSYDAAGRIDSVHTYGGAAVYNGYTAHGGLVWFTKRDSVNVTTRSESYTIDPLGNTHSSSIVLPSMVDGGTHLYESATGRLHEIQQQNGNLGDFTQLSVYDFAGNQIAASRLNSVPDINVPGSWWLTTNAQSAYDANGRLRSYLEQATPPSGATVYPEEKYTDQTTRYDALGRRVWVKTRHIADGPCGEWCSVERFVWDGDQLLEEFRLPDSLAELDTALVYGLRDTTREVLDPAPKVRQYSWLWGQVLYVHGLGMDQPLVVHRGGAGTDSLDMSSFAMYPLHDWRGNATAVAFAQGRPLINNNAHFTPPLATAENQALTAYRRRTSDSRRVTTWMGSLLTGQMTAMGLEYRRNRYYDPKSGRFTQEDPIGFGGGLNLYGFGGGDPVNYDDPLGLLECNRKTGEGCSDEFRRQLRFDKGLERPFIDPVAIVAGALAAPLLAPAEATAVGGLAAVRTGQAGEAAVRAVSDIGEKVAIRVGGRTRIPDGLTSTVLTEVKNVRSLSYTQQLRDFAAHAEGNGLRFDLWVRKGAELSGPLQQTIRNGAINLRIIP